MSNDAAAKCLAEKQDLGAGAAIGLNAGFAARAQDIAGAMRQIDGAAIGQIVGSNKTTPVLRTIGDKLDLAIRQAEAEVVRLKSIKAETAHDLLSVNLDTFYSLKTF